ncbi:MAG TPA: lysylphosphatidylglycerol synthase transmembrane domain-containing protein [Opitutaceae bacterium]|nr:lysylphosphatidylglycerol synthase transmembrane domain-containing protein [Opitutaceae bacterium]
MQNARGPARPRACLALHGWQKGAVRLTAFLASPAGTLLRYLCSLGLLAWIAARVDWAGLRGLSALAWPAAAPAVLLAGLAYPVQAWRWQVLLRAQGVPLPPRRVHRAFWIGQFYNAFLPGGVAGDAVRFAAAGRHHPERRAAVAAGLVADRLLGLAALCALALLAVALHAGAGGRTAGLEPLLIGSAAAFGIVLAAGWTATRTRAWEPLTRRLLGPARAAALHDAALALGRAHAALAAATALSVAVWLLDFAATWLLARAVGLPAGPLPVAIAAAAAYVAAALPVSIGGHGVREGALVAVLALLGYGGGHESAVAALAVAFWGISVGWSLVGGLVQLVPSGAEK